LEAIFQNKSMDGRKLQFLRAVLGVEGAQALIKATERGPALESAIIPRTIMAWLGVASRSDFDDEIPGVPTAHLKFVKSENGYSGSIDIEADTYKFDSASVNHLGACVAVALGADCELDSEIRDLDIKRLGKSIDLLTKAQVVKDAQEEDLKKAISSIKVGRALPGRQGGRQFDYNHVLAPQHRQDGYSLTVGANTIHDEEADDGLYKARLYHQNKPIGFVEGRKNGGILDIEYSVLDPRHRGKGLGTHMYEALLAHGLHTLEVKRVTGNVHSTSANGVHRHLAARHGLGYFAEGLNGRRDPSDTQADQDPDDRAFDNKFGGYNYAIKAEMEMTFKAERGVEAPGPAHAPTEPLQATPPTPPTPTQTSKGPTVGMRPQLPKLPKVSSSHEQIQTGPGATKPKAKVPAGKSPSLKVTKSQAQTKCPVCSGHQFNGDKFVGCICFKSLAKSVVVTAIETGYNLEFKDGWDSESILTLLESLGKN
jgi:GNAT superfamily N-acetyltransferase